MFYKKERAHFKINYQPILFGILIFLSVYQIYQREMVFYSLKKNPDFNVGETPEKVCFYGLNSIMSNTPQTHYFSQNILDSLKDNPNILGFSSEDKIIDIIYRDNKCRVITKNETQMRGFLLFLEKSMEYPLYYKITELKEDDIETINLKDFDLNREGKTKRSENKEKDNDSSNPT